MAVSREPQRHVGFLEDLKPWVTVQVVAKAS